MDLMPFSPPRTVRMKSKSIKCNGHRNECTYVCRMCVICFTWLLHRMDMFLRALVVLIASILTILGHVTCLIIRDTSRLAAYAHELIIKAVFFTVIISGVVYIYKQFGIFTWVKQCQYTNQNIWGLNIISTFLLRRWSI